MTAQEKTAIAIISIGGMHCPACSARVTKALQALPGVQAADVSLEAKEAKVTYISGKITPKLLQQVITAEGYTFEGVKFND
jgi:Cu+-exporting ATPase